MRALRSLQHLTVLHLPDMNRYCFLPISVPAQLFDRLQAVYVKAPLNPCLFLSSDWVLILDDRVFRRVVRFPLPGPWVDRAFASIDEVPDV